MSCRSILTIDPDAERIENVGVAPHFLVTDIATEDRLLSADPAGGLVRTTTGLDERRMGRRRDGLAGERLAGKAAHGGSGGNVGGILHCALDAVMAA